MSPVAADDVALVTGAAYGIGRATAVALAAAGADLVLVDVDGDRLRSVAAEVSTQGRAVLTITADLADRSEVERAVTETLEWRGHCDVLISNAAIMGEGAPHEFSLDDWEAFVNVNLWPSVVATRALIPSMLANERGHLVYVSSGWGLKGHPTAAPYSMTKFALIGLAESVAMYLGATGVKVSLVLPGAVGGDHNHETFRLAGRDRRSSDELDAGLAQRQQVMRPWPSPESMAATIIEGIAENRFYVCQQAPGYEDWVQEEMLAKWKHPEDAIARASRN